MPQKSKFGFIPPLELLKLWVDYGFWYDRQRCEAKQIKDMQLMAAMAPPGGGRNAFSQRLQVNKASVLSSICLPLTEPHHTRMLVTALHS